MGEALCFRFDMGGGGGPTLWYLLQISIDCELGIAAAIHSSQSMEIPCISGG